MSTQVPQGDATLPPISQKQEDVLIELFLQLSVEDRKAVVKFCRDLALKQKEAR